MRRCVDNFCCQGESQNVTTAGCTPASITGDDSADYTANFAQVGGNYQISFTAVPELGAVVSLLGGLGMLLGLNPFRRRGAKLL